MSNEESPWKSVVQYYNGDTYVVPWYVFRANDEWDLAATEGHVKYKGRPQAIARLTALLDLAPEGPYTVATIEGIGSRYGGTYARQLKDGTYRMAQDFMDPEVLK